MTLTWYGWTLVLLFAFNALLSVATVGKARKPIEPGAAVFVVIFDALLILGAVLVGTTP